MSRQHIALRATQQVFLI